MICRTVTALLCLCAAAQAAAPVGILSTVSGNVQIVRAGQKSPVPARTADLIAAGDRVLTGKSSEAAFLFCPESSAAKVLANADVQFEATSVKVRKGKLGNAREVPSCRLPANLTLAGASQMESAMMRLRAPISPLRSPSRTNIASLQPRFRWVPVNNADTYEVKLMDGEERILWRQSVSSTEVQYPSDAQALAWGEKYWWRVTARKGEEPLTEANSYFRVLLREEAERVRATESNLRRALQENPADNGPRFLLAFLYEENGMLDEAAWVYSELTDQREPQEWVRSRLTELMNKLGWDQPESRPFRIRPKP